MRIALIDNAVVVNVIASDSIEWASTLGYEAAVFAAPDVGIGWRLDGADLVPPADSGDVVAAPVTEIPRSTFVQRFSPVEWRVAKALIAQSAELEQGFDLLLMATTVNLASTTVQGIIALLGQLDPENFPPERVAAILAP